VRIITEIGKVLVGMGWLGGGKEGEGWRRSDSTCYL